MNDVTMTIDSTMYLCERVMAEICSEFDEDFGGEWDYDMNEDEQSFNLKHNEEDIGVTMAAPGIHQLRENGFDEVQIYKMFYSAWKKLLPEAYPHLKGEEIITETTTASTTDGPVWMDVVEGLR